MNVKLKLCNDAMTLNLQLLNCLFRFCAPCNTSKQTQNIKRSICLSCKWCILLPAIRGRFRLYCTCMLSGSCCPLGILWGDGGRSPANWAWNVWINRKIMKTVTQLEYKYTQYLTMIWWWVEGNTKGAARNGVQKQKESKRLCMLRKFKYDKCRLNNLLKKLICTLPRSYALLLFF